MADKTEELMQTLIDLMTTPPQKRGLGRGPCKKPVGNGSVEIAIAQNENGWQFHDRTIKEWVMYPHECIEATLVNYDIRKDVEIKEKDKAEFDRQIRELQEDIALLQNNPDRLQSKQAALQDVYNRIDDKQHYVYLYLTDSKQSYSIRCRPHNNFVRSLFGTLTTILKFKKSALSGPIKIAPMRQEVTDDPAKKVIFSNLWIDDILQYAAESDRFSKSDWTQNWQTHVDRIGGEIRRLHRHGKPYFGVSTALPPSADDNQAALPPSQTPEDKFADLQSSVNEAFNNSDTDKLKKILVSLNTNPKAIASLGEYIEQAKEYVLQTQKALQGDDVIDVESTPIVEAAIVAEEIAADNPANPKSTVKDDEEF